MSLIAWQGRIVSAVILLAASMAQADDKKNGTVRVPLSHYQQIYQKAHLPPDKAVPPPVAYSLSQAEVKVTVSDQPGQPAQIEAALTVHVLSEDWLAVPILPAGTPVTSATLGNKALALTLLAGDLVWSTKGKGTHQLKILYTAPVTEAARGKALLIPLPPAAAIRFSAAIAGQGLTVSAVPTSGINVSESNGLTQVTASVPRTNSLRLAYALASGLPALITGADYRGRLQGAVVRWQATVDVRVQSADPVTLPLLANSVALSQVSVDGRPAVVEEKQGHLHVQIRGAGRHRVKLEFETQVQENEGPTATSLWLPRPPVSSFRLDLPGKKEIDVAPAAGIEIRRAGGRTLASIHLPPTDSATFSWSEALPDGITEKLRANAEVVHVVRAEEGVLKIEALAAFQVTRGATNVLRAHLPLTVVVNQVLGAGVTDWQVGKNKQQQELTIYLDRDIRSDYRLTVAYELLVGNKEPESPPVTIPLLAMGGVHRQRGMVALLSGTELSMRPQKTVKMTKVGENQLPSWVREGISQTVAHTYKYVDLDAALAAQLAPPERRQGKFDATIDTLFSVGDGVMKALASVEIAIKSGKLMDLDLTLPTDINLISVNAPSLRDHQVIGEEGGSRTLQLMFTKELQGALRIEIAFERVLGGSQQKLAVPAIHIPGADMEQGRLAVEALTAVDIQPAAAMRVLPIDVQDLPRQLTLRTTNPILLAYKYVHALPPFHLELEIKHHAEMQVQVAAIDRATYQTLVTRHGLTLTRVVSQIRNRRKQFLKIALPPDSELWSAMLAGQPVKPAQGAKKKRGTGAPVEISHRLPGGNCLCRKHPDPGIYRHPGSRAASARHRRDPERMGSVLAHQRGLRPARQRYDRHSRGRRQLSARPTRRRPPGPGGR